jgi:thiosulfate reductase cytochrome b subunit
MWLLVINGLVYLAYGVFSGHYRQDFFPVSVKGFAQGISRAVRGHLAHVIGEYNIVQRAAYLGVIASIILVVLSGLVIWKPIQFHALGLLMGNYEGARLVHFFCMVAIVLFVVIHVFMALMVPKTIVPMITGHKPDASRTSS